MATGKISRLMPEQGFGFIQENGHDGEIEFHWTALTAGQLNQLRVGQLVHFDTRPDQRDQSRIRAVNVRLVH